MMIKTECLSGLPTLNSPLRFSLGYNLGSVTLLGHFCQDSSDLPFVVICRLLRCIWLRATQRTAACQASSITSSWSLPKFMSIESVMPSNHLILCCFLLFLPSIFPSIRVFSKESTLPIKWPKNWSFSFSISPSKEYSGLIGSYCSPRDSQESSPTPRFKSNWDSNYM